MFVTEIHLTFHFKRVRTVETALEKKAPMEERQVTLTSFLYCDFVTI